MTSIRDPRRDYLAQVLPEKSTDLKAASLAIGRSHSYLQQYVKYGKPAYLEEADREALVTLFGIDGDRLKPPVLARAKKALPEMKGRQPELTGEISEQEKSELLRIWAKLPRRLRNAALLFLTEAVPEPRSKVG